MKTYRTLNLVKTATRRVFGAAAVSLTIAVPLVLAQSSDSEVAGVVTLDDLEVVGRYLYRTKSMR